VTQSSLGRYVLLGLRFVLAVVSVVLVYKMYRHDGYKEALLLGLICLVGPFLPSGLEQGAKLADANMRKHGLNPDREEAQPACKAIDN
jgi:hypothetical protein